MYIALLILLSFSLMSALIFYSGYIACKTALYKRTEEYFKVRKELEFIKFQNETLCKEIRDEKNKGIIMESLLKQKKK